MNDQETIDAVGSRLRAARATEGATLAEVSARTGISVSTLSRLESGQRRASLALLLPLARAYRVPLDALVSAHATADPRVRPEPIRLGGRILLPLTRHPGGVRAYKMVVPGADQEPSLQSHAGYEWMYVLAGKVRLRLGELDLRMEAGEAAEFDTRTPHWFGSATGRAAELLVLFGPQGERMHVRARPRAGPR